tara:strand:- start:197 stop:493 length:297 start_codon:yes stop_codon:yes gene_type:complete
MNKPTSATERKPEMTKHYVIKAGMNRIIGDGPTKKAAWEDAYGPKPWPPYTKKTARNAWVEETTEEKAMDDFNKSVNRDPELTGFYDEDAVPGEFRFH